MNTIHLEELYNRHIKPLSLVERMRLVTLIMQDLAQPMQNSAEPPKSQHYGVTWFGGGSVGGSSRARLCETVAR